MLILRRAACVECNAAAPALVGLERREELVGKTPLDFAPPMQPAGMTSLGVVRWNSQVATERGSHAFEWTSTKKSGESFLMKVRLSPFRPGGHRS